MQKRKFVIIDGHALIHRAYHAIPPLTTKQGEVVNAVYGFSVILLNVIKDLNPECIAVAFDLPDETFRHKEYKEYKANRTAAPDDLVKQFATVKEVVEAFSIPIYEEPGYEADDVIGSLAKKLSKDEENEIFIVTGDLDELQLVNKNTKVYTMKRGFTDTVIYDEKMVLERYGLTPKEFIDFKALKGDPSDNIPGVPGIGEKTAIDLIKTYGDLDNVYQNTSEIKSSISKKLTENKELAYMSRNLSTIVTDLPLNISYEACATHVFDRNKLFELFRRLEFKSLLSKLPSEQNALAFYNKETPKPKSREHFNSKNYHLVRKEEELKGLLSELTKAEVMAVDTETDSLNEIEAKLVGISFSIKEGEAYYLPLGHQEGEQLTVDTVKKYLEPVLSGDVKKTGHNIKFDYCVLKSAGFNLEPIAFDSMVAAYLLNPNARAQRLDELAFSEFGVEMSKIEELIGKGKDAKTFAEVDIDKATLYAAEDADMSLRLYHAMLVELKKVKLFELMQNIEAPLIPVLGDMEMAGVKIDTNLLRDLSAKFGKRILVIEKEIFKISGVEFNINSPAQLQKVLFDKLKLQDMVDKKSLKKLSSGGYSTGAEELEKLRGTNPIIELILENRELTKLKNTYIDTLPLLVSKKTGRIHTSFNQAIAATGRLSSSDPNLQNIPIRSDLGQEIRKAFIADEGKSIVSADYSQIELRIIAHIADDKTMKQAFTSGLDIHTSTAAKVYNVSEKEVTPAMRHNAKAVNFGIVYGVSPHGLARQSELTYEQAKEFIDKYFETHQGIKKYMKEVVIQAHKKGYAETIFGRRRYLPELNSSNFVVRNSGERMALNMPIQGTAADLIKLAMIEIARDLPSISMGTRMLLQVHDELVFEVPDEDIEIVKKFVKERMENVITLSVPITVEIGVGKNWGDAK